MGQKFRDDKIGTLSHSGGNIIMSASTSNPAYITIGGQQWKVTSSLSRTIATDVTMTANSLYMVYAVRNGGNIELRISSNVNSAGPSGFTSWKLIGAFYANGLVSVAFGAFIKDINSAPESESWNWTPTGAWTSNISYFGKARRSKEFVEMEIYAVCSGAPSPNVQLFFNNPTNLTTDTSKLPNGVSNFYYAGGWTGQDNGVNSRGGLVQLLGGTMYPYYFAGGTSTVDGVNLTTPFTWGNLDAMTATLRIPVVGWDATPIKDL